VVFVRAVDIKGTMLDRRLGDEMTRITQCFISVAVALPCLSCAYKPRWDEAEDLIEQRYAHRSVYCEVGSVEVKEGRYLELADHVTRSGCFGVLRVLEFIETECTDLRSYNGCGRIEIKKLLNQARVVGNHIEVPCGIASVIPRTISGGFGRAVVSCRQVVKLDTALMEDTYLCESKAKESNIELGNETVSWKWGTWELTNSTPALRWETPNSAH
jgi:hypothetical protein